MFLLALEIPDPAAAPGLARQSRRLLLRTHNGEARHVDIGLVHELFDGVGHAAAGTTDRQYRVRHLGAQRQSLRPNHQPVNPAWMPALISRTWVPPDRLAAILSRDSAARSAPASFCDCSHAGLQVLTCPLSL